MLNCCQFKQRLCVAACLLFCGLIFCSFPLLAEKNKLTMGIHPFESASGITEQFSSLAQLLGQTLNAKINIHISKDYAEHINQVANQSFDIAYLGPVSYISLVKKYGQIPLLARLEINGKPTFQGKIFTTVASNIKSIQQLKGKRFAFGNKSSTMSYIVPKYVLEQHGVSLDSLVEYAFLGNHDNVALGVLTGKFDAGAVKEAVFAKYESKGLHLIANTPSFSEHLFVARADMSHKMIEKIKTSLLNIHKTTDGEKALLKIKKGLHRLVSVQDGDYDNLREIFFNGSTN